MIDLDFQDAVSETAGANGHYRPKESQFESWAQAALMTAGQTNGELTIRLVEEDESQELNHEYRDKNKPTNVLSFPFEMPDEVELPTPILGDLIICVEVVNQESVEQGKEPDHHWAHMVVHGCLHLLGFDHITDEDAEEMESLETKILADMGINDPYQPIND